MTKHTTHFEDCGCISAERDALKARVAELEGPKIHLIEPEPFDLLAAKMDRDALRAEVERLRGALADLIASGENYMEYHKRKLYSDSGPSNVVGLTPALEKAKQALAGKEAEG